MESSGTHPPPTVPHAAGLNFSALAEMLGETAKAYSADKVPKMGAALSYYTAFSLAPLVILILSLASLAVQKDVARQEIVSQFTNLMGDKGGAAVQDILDHAASTKSASWGTLVSFLVLLIGASGAFGELQDSLNQIWDVPPQNHPWLTMIKDRALSFAMVFVLGFFMLASLLLSAIISGLSRVVAHDVPAISWEVANGVISFVVISGLFAVIFRLLPDVRLTWNDVWLGSVFSGVLFIAGKFLIGWYIGRSATFSSYGAAGSFVVILVWVFYSAQILYLGAEFTRVYTLRFGSHRGSEHRNDKGEKAAPPERKS